jgi:hypothetical protein
VEKALICKKGLCGPPLFVFSFLFDVLNHSIVRLSQYVALSTPFRRLTLDGQILRTSISSL